MGKLQANEYLRAYRKVVAAVRYGERVQRLQLRHVFQTLVGYLHVREFDALDRR